MNTDPIRKVVIVGGGTAGWMAAAAVSEFFKGLLEVELVESDEIGIVGVGEATIPPLVTYLRLLDIKEQDFMAATQATFKLGIAFENWRNVNEDYIHSFGTTGRDHWSAGFQHFWLRDRLRGSEADYGDYCLELKAAEANRFSHLPKQGLNYAFHIDATLFAKFLRGFSEPLGVRRVEGRIMLVDTDPENGEVTSLRLDSGQLIEGDLFIDCTGFRGMLVEETLHTGYEDWSHWLPCNSAVAMQTESTSEAIPYTRAIAHEAGWQWRIPLQHRVGNGLVYCSRYLGDDEATAKLRDNVLGEPVNEPRVLKFRTGRRLKNWNKNVIALGLASGFVEPLESTSIHLIQTGISRLLEYFPRKGFDQVDIDEYNRRCTWEFERIRDFLILHYHANERTDSQFWIDRRELPVPAELHRRMDLFRANGRIHREFDELFTEVAWLQVMLGQGIVPEQYHPVVDVMGKDELNRFLANIKNRVDTTVSQLPIHDAYIEQYCRASPV